MGGSEKSLFLWSDGSEKNRLFTGEEMFKMMPLCLHACMQLCCPTALSMMFCGMLPWRY